MASFVTTNEKQFNLALAGASREVPGMHLKFQKRVAIEGLRRIVFKTPVDTGRARGSWQGAGITNESVTGRFDPSGSDAISRGSAAFTRIRKPFGVMFIFSNLSYIVPLEEGHSQAQAPQGMVAVTVRELAVIATVASRGIRFRTRR